MAVHVPLSVEAQIEARVLMMSINNILSPANGKPITVPSQDMVLGCYWLTREQPGAKGEGKIFSSPAEVRMAYDAAEVSEHARIKVRGLTPIREPGMTEDAWRDPSGWKQSTTVGRVLFGEILPPGVPFEAVNLLMTKKELTKLIDACYRQAGHRETVIMLDRIKDLGFSYATRAGVSICVDDMRSEEHTSELQSQSNLVCRLLLEKKKKKKLTYSRDILSTLTHSPTQL